MGPALGRARGHDAGRRSPREWCRRRRGRSSSRSSPTCATSGSTNEDAGVFVGSYDLAPAILEFCTDHPSDPDCATDLSMAKADSPDPAVAGESVTYTLTVTNHGPNPAQAAGGLRPAPRRADVRLREQRLYGGRAAGHLSARRDPGRCQPHPHHHRRHPAVTGLRRRRAGHGHRHGHRGHHGRRRHEPRQQHRHRVDTLVVAVADVSIDAVTVERPARGADRSACRPHGQHRGLERGSVDAHRRRTHSGGDRLARPCRHPGEQHDGGQPARGRQPADGRRRLLADLLHSRREDGDAGLPAALKNAADTDPGPLRQHRGRAPSRSTV